MAGYLNNEEATRDTIVDEWLHTGDIARCDQDGFFFMVDRLKELIKVKGLQVGYSYKIHYEEIKWILSCFLGSMLPQYIMALSVYLFVWRVCVQKNLCVHSLGCIVGPFPPVKICVSVCWVTLWVRPPPVCSFVW